jgi:hypothetical protein
MEWLIYLIVGCLAGLGAGLLGIGGGLVIVPALVWVYSQMGDVSQVMHTAVGTSLATIIFTSLSSSYSHYLYHNINWQVLRYLMPGLVVGAGAGSVFIVSSSNSVLQMIFITYLLVVAFKFWLPISRTTTYPKFLNRTALGFFGFIAGGLSALVGIGGGTLIVPYLSNAGLAMKQAIGSSSVCGFPIALVAVICLLIMQYSDVTHADITMAIIDWKAVAGITSTSLLFARLGAKLTTLVSVNVLQKLFSVLLIIVAVDMWIQNS